MKITWAGRGITQLVATVAMLAGAALFQTGLASALTLKHADTLVSTEYRNRSGALMATCPTVIGAHFVITKIDNLADAPASITVQWSSGSETVNLDLDAHGDPKFNGGTAQYTTPFTHNGQTISDATASIYDGWVTAGKGNFNLSHWICADTATVTISPLTAVNNVGPGTEAAPQRTSHTFTVTVTGTAALVNPVTITPTVTPATTLSPNSCGSVAPVGNTATCSFTISSTSPAVYTASATASGTVGADPFSASTDGTAGNGSAATKTFACQAHTLTLGLTGAGKSAPSYAGLNGGGWSVTFSYQYATFDGTTWSAFGPLTPLTGVLQNPGGGLANLNFSAAGTIPTPSAAYTAKVLWKFSISDGTNTVYASGLKPSVGDFVLGNTAGCSGADSAISPVSDVTVFKVLDPEGDGGSSIFDTGISGWTITATSGSTVLSGVTTADGSVQIAGLDDLVTWTIAESPARTTPSQTRWIQTFPSFGGSYTRIPLTQQTQAEPDYVFGNTPGTSKTATALQKANGDAVALNSAVPLGTSMQDTATVTTFPTPTGAPAATGTVTFTFYKGDCATGTVVATNTVALGSASSATGPLAAGSYAFLAAYSGDGRYAGSTADCEKFSVSKGDLTLATDVKNGETSVTNGSVALGTSVRDTASVSGANVNFAPAGTVTFNFLKKGDCTTGTQVDSDSAALSGTTASSLTRGPLSAADGPYAFQAGYAGDPNYNDIASSDCEKFSVSKADLGLTTTMYAGQTTIASGGEAPAGSLPLSVRDTATASGIVPAFAPSNSVTFSFFANGTCANGGAGAGSAALSGNLADGSTPQSIGTAGAYSFLAAIASDGNYNGAAATCESFTVTTVTINKLANGGNATFNFTLGDLTPSVTTTGTPGTGATTVAVTSGSLTLGEGSQQGWQLVGTSCAGGSATFTAAAGTNTACNVENTHNGATRTQGFWSTHTGFANDKWGSVVAASANTLPCAGNPTITAIPTSGQNVLMGSFWSNISQTSTGTKRSALGKSRMQLLQQISAALLNRYGLGADDAGRIATAISAYCGTSTTAITNQTGILSTWNQSGDNVPLTAPSQAATTQLSKSQANLIFWDTKNP